MEWQYPGWIWEEHSGGSVEDRLEEARLNAGYSCNRQKPGKKGLENADLGRQDAAKVSL